MTKKIIEHCPVKWTLTQLPLQTDALVVYGMLAKKSFLAVDVIFKILNSKISCLKFPSISLRGDFSERTKASYQNVVVLVWRFIWETVQRRIKLLWIFIYKFLFEHLFPILLVIYLLRNCQNASQSRYTILHSHQWCIWEFISPHPH